MKTSAPPIAVGRVAGAAALIAVLTVASRLAGFGRITVFTWVMGDHTDLGDIYLVANTVPNIIFEIVAGGALASLVVPLLAGGVAAGDRKAVSATTSALLTWTVTLLVPIALGVALLADPIVSTLAGDLSPAQAALGGRMLRIFAPQLPLYGIGIVLTGVLQAHRRFAWPVIAPLLSSLTVIGVYLTFAAIQGRQVSAAAVNRTGELVLAGGTTLGVVVLSLSLLIPLRRLRLRLRPGYTLRPDVRRQAGGLALAGAVAVTAQQIALLALLRTAAGGPDGTVVVYNLAQAIYLLPWSILAVPLAVAAYPNLAAAITRGDEESYRRTLAPTVRGVLLLSYLGAAALIAIADPVARFFPGVTGPAAVSAAIIGFSPGLLGYGLFAVLSRALYARGDTGPVTAVTAAGWLAVPAAAVLLAAGLPIEQRATAVAVASTVGMLVLGGLLITVTARWAGPAALAGLTRTALVGLAAGALAAAAGRVLATSVPGLPGGTPTKWDPLLQGMLSGVVVVAVFLAVAYPLDRQDVRPMVRTLGRRLRAVTGRIRPWRG